MNKVLTLGLPIFFTVVLILWAWLEFHHFAGEGNDSDERENDDL